MPSTRRNLLAAFGTGAVVGAGGVGAYDRVSKLAAAGREPPVECRPTTHDWPTANYDAARTSAPGDRALPDADAEMTRLFPNARNGGGRPVAGGGMATVPVVDRGVAYAAGTAAEARNVADGERRWVHDLEDDTETSPVLGCGALFVSTLNGTVALDRDDGSVQWEADVGTGLANAGPVLTDDTLFVPTDGVVALDAETGDRVWDGEPSDVRGLAVADRVYATLRRNDEQSVVALDRTTGDELWRTGTPGGAWSPPVVGDRHVYVLDKPGTLTAMARQDGTVVWQRRVANGVSAPPAVGAGLVVAPPGNADEVVALDAASGERRWSFETGLSESTPVVLGESVLVTSANDGCYLLDAATGQQQWHAGDLGVVEAQPAVADGHLFYLDGTTSEGYVLG